MSSRWVTFSQQGHTMTSHVVPLLGETLSTLKGNAAPNMLLIIGNASSPGLQDHLKSPSSNDGDVYLRLCPQTTLGGRGSGEQTIMVFGSPRPRQRGKEEHSHGDVLELEPGPPTSHCLAPIYNRLFSPFFDVVCILVSSFTSLDALGDFLAAWVVRHVTDNKSRNLNVRPRLVVIVEEYLEPGDSTQAPLATDDPERLKAFLQDKTLRAAGASLSEAFCTFDVRSLSNDTSILRKRRYLKVMAFLLRHCAASRKDKQRQRTNFDARNVVDLFSEAYRCLLRNRVFDPLVASRRHEPVPSQSDSRISSFLSSFQADGVGLETKALPFLASALHLHAFPAGSHGFPFTKLFDILYKQAWRRAAQAAGLNAQCQGLLEHELLPIEACQPDDTTLLARRHLGLAKLHCDSFKRVKNNEYCPLCVLRRPEYTLPCGHMYCEPDIRLMGQATSRDTIFVSQCALCCQPMTPVIFRFRARARGVRVLSLDGGGVRGILLLDCLKLLESMVQIYLPGMPIIELFDVCAGTSSGGICILTLAHNGTPIKQAIPSFLNLSRRVFAKQPFWRQALNVLLHGSLYCNKAINEALQSHYGDGTLLDYSPAMARGAKLILTAKGMPCKDYVLSNFNSVSINDIQNGYEHALPPSQSRGVATWEAARATSAAPGFFTPHTIDGVGTFQDGGLWQNNPLAVAISEARAIWKSLTWPDISLSIGTGYQNNLKVDRPNTASEMDGSRDAQLSQNDIHGLRWKSGLIAVFFRLLYSLMDSPAMDGDKCHQQLFSQGTIGDEVKSRLLRLDVDLCNKPPRLDDITCIDGLRQEAAKQYQNNTQVQRAADLLISSLFYMEITHQPLRHDHHVSFQGRIMCDIAPGEQLQRLIEVLQEYNAEFNVGGRALSLREVERNQLRDHEFSLPVSGTVAGLETQFDIYLAQVRDGVKIQQGISRSPLSLDELMEIQGWDCPMVERPIKKSKRKRSSNMVYWSGRTKRIKT